MKATTYRDNVRQEQAGVVKTPTFKRKITNAFDAQALSLAKQEDSYMGDFAANATNPLMELADLEAKKIAKENGLEKAQEDFATTQKLLSTIEDDRKGILGLESEKALFEGEQVNQADFNQAEEDKGTTDLDVTIPSKKFKRAPTEEPEPKEEGYLPEINIGEDKGFSRDEKIDAYEMSIYQNEQKVKGLLERTNGFNVAEQYRADALNEMYLDKVSNDVKDTINKVFLANKNNPKGFEEEANKVLESLGSVPDMFKESVIYNTKRDIYTTKQKAVANLKTQQDAEIAASRNVSQNIASNEATQNAYMNLSTVDAVARYTASINAQVTDGSITPDVGKRAIRALQTDLAVAKPLGTVDRMLKNSAIKMIDKPKAILDYANNWVAQNQPDMDNELKLQTYNRMLTKANALESNLKGNNTAQTAADKDTLQDLIKRLSLTKDRITVGSKDIQEGEAISKRLGLEKEFKTAKTIYETLDEMNGLNINSQKIYVGNTMALLDKLETDGKGTFELRTIGKIIEDNYKANRAAIEKDTNAYIQKNPQIFDGEQFTTQNIVGMNSLVKTGENGNDYSDYIGGTVGEMTKRYNNRFNYKGHLGKYETLSDSESENMVRNYENMNAREKLYFNQELSKNLGMNEALNVYNKMWGKNAKNATPALMAGIKANYGRLDTATNITKGIDVMKGQDFIKPNKDFTTAKNESFMGTSQTMSHLSEDAKTLYRDTISAHYYGSGGNQDEFDSVQWEKSVNEVTNGTLERNGRTVFGIYPGQTQEQFDRVVRDITSPHTAGADYLENTHDKPPKGFSWDQVKQYLNFPRTYLESVGTGKYRVNVMVISDTQSVSTIMKNEDGSEFIIDFYQPNPDGKGAPVPYGAQ